MNHVMNWGWSMTIWASDDTGGGWSLKPVMLHAFCMLRTSAAFLCRCHHLLYSLLHGSKPVQFIKWHLLSSDLQTWTFLYMVSMELFDIPQADETLQTTLTLEHRKIGLSWYRYSRCTYWTSVKNAWHELSKLPDMTELVSHHYRSCLA